MRVRNLLQDAENQVRAKQYDSAHTSVEQAILLSRQQEHTPSLAASYYGMASVIWGSGGTAEDAHRYASLAAEHTKANTTTDLLVRTLIARIKAARGNYEAATILNEDLLRYYQENQRNEGIADILRSLGDLHRAQGNYALALEKYAESRAYYEKINDPLNLSGLLLSLGALKFQTNQLADARQAWQEARAIAEHNGYQDVLEKADEAMALLQE